MNKRLYELIEETVWALLENDPEYKEALAKHNRAVSQASGKPITPAVRTLENSFFVGGNIVGRAMFEMGYQLGRNPASIFDLPAVENFALVESDGAA